MLKEIQPFFVNNWIFEKKLFLFSDKVHDKHKVVIESRYYPRNLTLVEIENKNLKIKVDILNPSSRFLYSYYDNFEHKNVGLLYNNIIYTFNVEIKNLLEVIQYSRISKNGELEGTFKLVKVSGRQVQVLRLVPEDSSEHKFKLKISETYFSSLKPWTSKWKSGHIYINKRGILYLCLLDDISYYSKFNTLSYLYDNPIKKKKVLILGKDNYNRVVESKMDSISSILDLIFKRGFHYLCYYSTDLDQKHLGKDLGMIMKGCSLKEYASDKEHSKYLTIDLLLANNIWKKSKIAKENLIKEIKRTISDYRDNYKDNPEATEILDELGI